MKGFHTATPDQIRAGAVSDVYFQRTAAILDAKGVDAHVRAEFNAKSLPDGWDWAVFAGLAVVVTIGGFFDLKRLFRSIEAKHAEGEQDAETDVS